MKSTIVVFRNGLFPYSESVFEKKKAQQKNPTKCIYLVKCCSLQKDWYFVFVMCCE